MHQKSECVDLNKNIYIYVQKGQFGKNSSLAILLSSLVFLFSSQRHFITFFIIKIFLCHRPLPFSTRAPLLPLLPQIHWTMLVDNVDLKICLLGTSTSMVTLAFFFPWCKLKWSQDEFNSQSHILQGLGTTSWSMV